METLITARLILRKFCMEDLNDFFEYAKNLNVGPNAGWKPHESKEDSSKILKDFIEKDEVWAIVDRSSSKGAEYMLLVSWYFVQNVGHGHNNDKN